MLKRAAPISIRRSGSSDLGIANKHLVAVARACRSMRSVVIMDEPTAALSTRRSKSSTN
jgi:ABC-type sugar transport system ATPase subunit